MDFGLTVSVKDPDGVTTLVDVTVSGRVATFSGEQSLALASRSSFCRYVLNLLALQGLEVDQFIWSDGAPLSS